MYPILLIFSMWMSVFPTSSAQQGTVTLTDTSGNVPDVYYIQRGDTLWDISTTFLGDPQLWPDLWSINEYITNPHWIYPGNRIVFTMGSLIDPPKFDLDGQGLGEVASKATDPACGPDVRFDYRHPPGIYTAAGFLKQSKDINVLGRITKAPKNQAFLVEDNKVYIRVNDLSKYECGDILTVFRRVKKRVRHPDNYWTNYGSMYMIVGEVKVVHKFGDYLTAVIRQSYSEITRGDAVGPKEPAVIQTEVKVPEGTLRGTVIERLSQKRVITTNRDMVFLDRGKADGVKIGDTFYITHQRDEYYRVKKNDRNLPPRVVGRVVVVRVNKTSSAAIVVDSSQSVEVGDIITQKVD